MRGSCLYSNFAAGDDRFLGTKIMCRLEEQGCEEQARPKRLKGAQEGYATSDRVTERDTLFLFSFEREMGKRKEK